jgi:transposase-like protein
LLAERGVEVDHVTIYRWVLRCTPLLADAARPCRHLVGDRWCVDETYVKVAGQWRYVYRAIDQFGQVVDVFVAVRRDAKAAYRFFERAIGTTKVTPVGVTTDKAPMYSAVLQELLPAAWHRTDRYANNRVECDHGRLKARLRPMRGLKRDRTARMIIAGHAFVQNVRRGITSWPLRSRQTGECPSRSTSWSWRSDPRPRSPLQPVPGRRNATVSIGEAVREDRCQDPTPVSRYDPQRNRRPRGLPWR